MPGTTSRVLAAVSVAGLTSLAVAIPASAAPPPSGCKPVAGKPAYPPGQCKKPGVSDSTAQPGQSLTATSGEGQFDPGSTVTVIVTGPDGQKLNLGSVTVNSAGEAVVTFKVPTSWGSGSATISFTGPFGGVTRSVNVPFKVTGAGGGGSSLPFTGFGITAASLLGVGLVGAGTASVLVGRKRKVTPGA